MPDKAWVYIVTNKPRGVLYIGVTTNIRQRARQHRSGNGSSFTNRYNCDKLVLVEEHPSIEQARIRERTMKAWKRSWKIELIELHNSEWRDLGNEVA